jgi:hypothetical protein
MPLTKKKKQKDVPLWSYRTEHVDLMLWQYGCGLMDATNEHRLKSSLSYIEEVNKCCQIRFDYLASMYVEPSFKIELVLENNQVALQKISL